MQQVPHDQGSTCYYAANIIAGLLFGSINNYCFTIMSMLLLLHNAAVLPANGCPKDASKSDRPSQFWHTCASGLQLQTHMTCPAIDVAGDKSEAAFWHYHIAIPGVKILALLSAHKAHTL